MPACKRGFFSKDETIFLVRSPKDKYDVDSVDTGLCLGGQVQHAQAGAGPRCAAWTRIWRWANSVAGSGLDIWFSVQFNCAPKHRATCKEQVYSFPCFCCFLSTGRMLSLLMASPTWCWDHPRDHHPLLSPSGDDHLLFKQSSCATGTPSPFPVLYLPQTCLC